SASCPPRRSRTSSPPRSTASAARGVRARRWSTARPPHPPTRGGSPPRPQDGRALGQLEAGLQLLAGRRAGCLRAAQQLELAEADEDEGVLVDVVADPDAEDVRPHAAGGDVARVLDLPADGGGGLAELRLQLGRDLREQRWAVPLGKREGGD